MAASSGAGNTHTRVFIDKQSPAVYAAQVEVAKAVRGAVSFAGFDRRFAELINVRVSQINRCAYCLNLHTTAAVKAGETTQRLAVLTAWRAAPALFSDKERAALTLAESITTLPDEETQDHQYRCARAVLTEDEVAAVSWLAIAMNSFNRISIVSRHRVRAK